MGPLAITTGGLLLLVALVMLVFGVAYGLYTVRGSGIGRHPHREQRAPGAHGPMDQTMVDQDDGSTLDQDDDSTLDQRGTR
jgi:hypothetical protein